MSPDLRLTARVLPADPVGGVLLQAVDHLGLTGTAVVSVLDREGAS